MSHSVDEMTDSLSERPTGSLDKEPPDSTRKTSSAILYPLEPKEVAAQAPDKRIGDHLPFLKRKKK